MNLEQFKKDLNENARGNDRAPKYKLKNGDNKLVILTNPVGFSSVYGIGLVYEGAEFAKYGSSRKYKCYVLDLSDNGIKIIDLSYTTAGKLIALSEGARTKFDKFPMPYSVNLKTTNAGTTNIETEVLADLDFELPESVKNELAQLTPIEDIVSNLKKWTEKQVETNPEMQEKVKNYMDKKEAEAIERQKAKDEEIPVINYDDTPNNLDDIPF